MNMFYIWALLLWFSQGCASAQPPTIVDKPIIYDKERKELSLQYMQERYGIEASEPVIDPCMIVVHWTSIPTLEGSFEAFYPSRLPSTRAGIQGAGALNVSVPYLIDRDGTIYQLMPDTLFARHVIGLNHCAIGIENVGDGDGYPLTEAQFRANKQLICYLAQQYDIQYLIGHHEYQRFRQHPLWLEKDPNYLTEKEDPGDSFMQRLRNDLKELDFLPLPGGEIQKKAEVRQGIRGRVLWLEGNQMPGADDRPPVETRGKGVERTLHIHALTQRREATYQDGFFSELQTPLVKTVTSDEAGNFSVALDTGLYSVFVEEKKGLYANRFDGQGHIQAVEVHAGSVTELLIKIDYRAYY